MQIIYFDTEDRKNRKNGISRTKKGKIIIPAEPVPVRTVWVCKDAKEQKKFIRVVPIEEIKVEAGVLLTFPNGEKIRCSSNCTRGNALDDLFFPGGDKWWKGRLARGLDNQEIIKTILFSRGAVSGVEDDRYHDWELDNKNTKPDLEIENVNLSVIFRYGGEAEYLRFSEGVEVGFYLSFGPALVEKQSIIANTDIEIGEVRELYYGHSAYCSGLRGFWENITGFGASRAMRIAINNGAKSGLATYTVSKATGGPGWIEAEGNLVECLTAFYKEQEDGYVLESQMSNVAGDVFILRGGNYEWELKTYPRRQKCFEPDEWDYCLIKKNGEEDPYISIKAQYDKIKLHDIDEESRPYSEESIKEMLIFLDGMYDNYLDETCYSGRRGAIVEAASRKAWLDKTIKLPRKYYTGRRRR